jgi:hypothetical protein
LLFKQKEQFSEVVVKGLSFDPEIVYLGLSSSKEQLQYHSRCDLGGQLEDIDLVESLFVGLSMSEHFIDVVPGDFVDPGNQTSDVGEIQHFSCNSPFHFPLLTPRKSNPVAHHSPEPPDHELELLIVSFLVDLVVGLHQSRRHKLYQSSICQIAEDHIEIRGDLFLSLETVVVFAFVDLILQKLRCLESSKGVLIHFEPSPFKDLSIETHHLFGFDHKAMIAES